MRPTEEKRQQTINTYLKLLRDLKRRREIKGITSVVYRHKLHLTTSAVLQDMGVLDKYAHEYTWIYSGEVNEKLAEKVYEKVVEKMTKRVLSARDKAINKPESIRDYEPPRKFKQRYDFAKIHGFGEHSPISKMIKELGNGNYIYGHRLFERKFKDWMKRGRLITEIIQADQRDNLYTY